MNAPQILLICLMVFSFATSLPKHGQPETGNHNIWTTLIAQAILIGLLWWGGFW